MRGWEWDGDARLVLLPHIIILSSSWQTDMQSSLSLGGLEEVNTIIRANVERKGNRKRRTTRLQAVTPAVLVSPDTSLLKSSYSGQNVTESWTLIGSLALLRAVPSAVVIALCVQRTARFPLQTKVVHVLVPGFQSL